MRLLACAPDLDTTRTADTHSFGERVVPLMCKRIVSGSAPTSVLREQRRGLPRFIAIGKGRNP